MTEGKLPAQIGPLLRAATGRLRGSESARLDAELLLVYTLDRPRSYVLSEPDAALSPAQTEHFAALLARRAAGEPLAYLIGEREFWALPLKLSPAVLIPRPETELLVERSLALLAAQPAAVADLGTGSGAVALALASERPSWQITATDQSVAALEVAAANARRLELHNVRFLPGSWFEPLRGQRFALLVSNPPYVAESDPVLRSPPLTHEPREALASGADGTDALRTLIVGGREHLLPGGWLLLEHGAAQAGWVAKLLVAQGYAHVGCHQDLAGHARVTAGQAPELAAA
jgi:release factor glutamine methyltransferase